MKRFIRNILTPGFVMFILFFVVAWWAQRGRMLISWDEFTHWGLVVKNMQIFDALSNHPASTTVFKGYPPATALFEYFWIKVSKGYAEGNLYRAMNILYFSLMLPIFRNVRWKNPGIIVIRLILVLVLPLAFFQDFYTNILVDAILGVMFAGILINYYVNKMSAFKFIYISLALFTITITKASGFGLAIIAIVIISIDILLIQRKELMLYIKSDKIIHIIIRTVIVICPIIFTLISKLSWSNYLKVTKTDSSWNTSVIGFQSIKRLFTANAPDYQIETIKNFFYFLSDQILTNSIIRLSYIGWIALLLTISIILIKFVCIDGEKNRYKVVTVTILIGAIIYSASLLILYVFTFSVEEATHLASYSRYMSTYLLGALIFFVVVICLKEGTRDAKFKISCSMGILLSLLLIIKITPIADITLFAPSNSKNTVKMRQKFVPITKIKRPLKLKTDKMYIISVANNGYNYWVSRYLITPIRTNAPSTSSIGKPYYKGDIWTKDVDLKGWEEQLRSQYTYVYIFRTNDVFNKTYGKIFEGGIKSIKHDTLYYVQKKNGKVLLKMRK
ncbi:hypothetical protein LGK95_10610 [Clostridium algoriphilum]|uniref:hypothetical protein n=1 Tax=Clostridium algoriphilum TaxID=198347 RepID=UPI001CF0EA80|nr:hypothetical protein [Clostridium algoriphilum]MCB2293970.1 hypothetical protein [Clostridium algoriphilum]